MKPHELLRLPAEMAIITLADIMAQAVTVRGGISFQSNLGKDHIERGAKTVEGQQHIPNRPGTSHVLAVANQESTTQKG